MSGRAIHAIAKLELVPDHARDTCPFPPPSRPQPRDFQGELWVSLPRPRPPPPPPSGILIYMRGYTGWGRTGCGASAGNP
jgi:hypothetical protein